MNHQPARPREVTILGTGVAVPERVLLAADLDRQLNLPHGESFRVTGIRKRHIAVHETAASLASAAIERALTRAGVAWSEVDCLVCASATMDQALPYNAAMVLAERPPAARAIASLDIGASCLSFLQAMDLMSLALAAGRYDTVVIVSSDIASFTTDVRNLRENGIFGDGAAAAVLRRSAPETPSRILACRSVTLPEGADFCRIRSGGSRYHRRNGNEHANALFEMQGRPLFALVARHLPAFVDALLADAGVTRNDVSLFVPHQASRQALDHVAARLGFDDGRLVDVFSDFGNQVGASLPTALHHALEHRRPARGQTVLLLGSGAGVSLGGLVLVY